VWKGPEDVRQFPTGSLPVGLLPQEDTAVLLMDGPDSKGLGPIGTILVGNVAVDPVGSPSPAVEWALYAVTLHSTAMTDVGTQMRAVSIEDMEFSVLITVGNKILTEVTKGPHLPDRELHRPTDHVPAGRLPGERNPHVVSIRSARLNPVVASSCDYSESSRYFQSLTTT
jgi:hypothetical protein